MKAPDDFVLFCSIEHPRLVGALSLYCGNRDVAEDVAQEALSRACARWATVRQMAAPGAWVYRVAVNLANSHFRHARVGARILLRHRRGGIEHADPTEAIAVRQAVSSLPKRQRQAVTLRFYFDLSVDETASAMATTGSSVRSLTHRAMLSLRENLADSDVDLLQEADDVI
jgi:RNA polymerase sigma-70 factor (ECF subfamily)